MVLRAREWTVLMFDEEHKEHIAAGLRREDVQPTNCGVVCKEEIYRIYYVIYYIYVYAEVLESGPLLH